MSLQYLSQALVFSYLEYAPAPKNVWKQLNGIFEVAKSTKVHKQVFNLPDYGEHMDKTSFEHAYKRILMASLVDPHHLPFGAIWEIYEQLDDWATHTKVDATQVMDDMPGQFVQDLQSDKRPIPYKKFNREKLASTTRLLDARQLVDIVASQLEILEQGQPLPNDTRLSLFYARSLLKHMHSVWGLLSTRHTERRYVRGQVHVYSGMESVYYLFNGEQPFTAPVLDQQEDEIEITDNEQVTATETKHDIQFQSWRVVDQSKGGSRLFETTSPSGLACRANCRARVRCG